jgi:hypothetical protein
VSDAREAIEDEIRHWNAQTGPHLDAIIEPVMWESHSRPELGDRAQAIINKQLRIASCDFGIALFWSRLGTPTGEHGSGSLEEIDRLSVDFAVLPAQPG